MNAAARLVHQSVLTRRVILAQLLSKTQITFLTLSMLVIITAISMIYVTHVSRIYYAEHERNLAEHTQIQINHNQLLLEQSTLNAPAHVFIVAKEKLGMVLPEGQALIVIRK